MVLSFVISFSFISLFLSVQYVYARNSFPLSLFRNHLVVPAFCFSALHPSNRASESGELHYLPSNEYNGWFLRCANICPSFRGSRTANRPEIVLARLVRRSLIDIQAEFFDGISTGCLIDPWSKCASARDTTRPKRTLCFACRTCASRSNGFPFREPIEQTASHSFANVSTHLVVAAASNWIRCLNWPARYAGKRFAGPFTDENEETKNRKKGEEVDRLWRFVDVKRLFSFYVILTFITSNVINP